MPFRREELVHGAERLFAEAAAFTGPQLSRQASDERLSTMKESHLQKNFRAALECLAADASPRRSSTWPQERLRIGRSCVRRSGDGGRLPLKARRVAVTSMRDRSASLRRIECRDAAGHRAVQGGPVARH